MQVPLWLQRVTRTGTPTGLLLATGVSTAVFSATPLVLPSIVDRFGVGRGTAGLFSAAQLGAFVLLSWLAGRWLRPGPGLFRTGVAVLSAANLASVVIAHFAVFVAMRAVAGAALGLLTWLAWSQVFGDEERQGDVATIGPLTGVAIAPLLGVLLDLGDDRAVFALLAGIGIVPLLFTPEFHAAAAPRASRRTRPVPQAALLIVALALLTLGGSAVFVFGGVIMTDQLAMSPVAVSLAYASNALASIPTARWRGARPRAGAWLVLTGACAVGLGYAGEAWFAWAVVSLWGFAFWAGDAQAAMAAGRALGPLLGATVVNATSYRGLGLVGGGLMAVGGTVALGVEADRRGLRSGHG